MSVIAASELVMEKNEERRAVLRPFVVAKETRTNAQNASTPTNADAEMQTAPLREPFKNWWPSAESNHGHADFQLA